MFQGRNLLIATKHEKERVIAPILEKVLGVKCFTPPELDTDELGTFTGEVERKNGPIDTARNKCLMAMEQANCDLAVASEGSFGPHPAIHFVPSDDEFLILIDKQNNLEIIARELSLETNFFSAHIHSEKQLNEFSNKVNFPSHGLIIRKSNDDFSEIIKGITNSDELYKTFQSFITKHGKAYVETDMRAMHNPTRMRVIEKATYSLVDKAISLCPDCSTPGFAITDRKEGLPCQLCSFPTRSTLSHTYTCTKCNCMKEEKYPNGKQAEEPMYCDLCNP